MRFHALLPSLFLALLFLFSTCKKDEPDPPDDNNNNPPSGPVIDLVGTVIGENGVVIAGATVEFGNSSTTSDDQGFFRIENVSAASGRNYLTVERAGYFNTGKNFYVTESGEVRVKIKLRLRGLTGTIDAATGGSVQTAEGMNIVLPPNAIEGAYEGDVRIYANYIDPSDPISQLEIPGLEAINADDELGSLLSFGMGQIELEDDNGNALQLADGMMAELTIPVPDAMLPVAQQSIAMWYFDEEAGIWREEGEAELSGNNYVGEVGHFTFWNCDDFTCSYVAEIQVICPESDFDNLTVILELVDSEFPNGAAVTNEDGVATGALPCDEDINVYVILPGVETIVHYLGTFHTNEFDDGANYNINPECPQFTSVQGCAVDGLGVPVTDGYMYLDYGNYSSDAVYFDGDGCFEATIYDFDNVLTEAQIVAWDLNNFIMADGPTVPFNDQLNVLDEPIVIGGEVASSDGRLYVGSIDNSFYCLDAANGDLIWDFGTSAQIQGGISAAVWDNKVYFGNQIGEFFCLNTFDGSVIWSEQMNDYSNSPYVEDGVVYVSSGDGNVYCWDADNGDELWTYPLGFEQTGSSVTVANDLVYVGSGLINEMLAINKGDGMLAWNFDCGDEVQSSPCIADGKVIFGCYDQNIYALDALTGDLEWNTIVDTDQFLLGSPTADGTKVYIQSSYNVTALNLSNGDIAWQTTGEQLFGPDIELSGNRVYSFNASGIEGVLRSQNTSNGDTDWEESVETIAFSILVVDGVLFHQDGSAPYSLVARNANTGALIWTSEVATHLNSVVVMVDDEGTAHYSTVSGMGQ